MASRAAVTMQRTCHNAVPSSPALSCLQRGQSPKRTTPVSTSPSLVQQTPSSPPLSPLPSQAVTSTNKGRYHSPQKQSLCSFARCFLFQGQDKLRSVFGGPRSEFTRLRRGLINPIDGLSPELDACRSSCACRRGACNSRKTMIPEAVEIRFATWQSARALEILSENLGRTGVGTRGVP